MSDITMPSLGADMEAATLVEWNVAPGDEIHRGDIIFAVETDKGVIDVEAFEPGVVEKILVEPGVKVAVGTPLATLRGDASAATPTAASAAATSTPATSTTASSTTASSATPDSTDKKPTPSTAATTSTVPPASAAVTDPAKPEPAPATPHSHNLRASPAARRRARELDVDLEKLSGSGPHGAISIEDVIAAAAQAESAAQTRPAGKKAATDSKTEDNKTAGSKAAIRQAIAKAMARSKREIPHYYLSSTIDLSDTLQWLENYNAERPVTERVVYAVLLLKAVAKALKRVPELNGYWRNDGFISAEETRVGMAISLRGGGLVVPGLHRLTERSLTEVMTEFTDIVARSRSGRLRSSELSDVSITVTSLGEQGVETVFPIIYPPQVAIVGFGSVVERVMPVNGAIGIRRVITASLAADHRASDGHRGAIFLAELDRLLQDPENL